MTPEERLIAKDGANIAKGLSTASLLVTMKNNRNLYLNSSLSASEKRLAVEENYKLQEEYNKRMQKEMTPEEQQHYSHLTQVQDNPNDHLYTKIDNGGEGEGDAGDGGEGTNPEYNKTDENKAPTLREVDDLPDASSAPKQDTSNVHGDVGGGSGFATVGVG